MIALAPRAACTLPAKIQELQTTVSASRLNCFHSCRLKFYYRYVAELKKPATRALHVGKTVHAVLQEWNKARWRQETPTEESFKAAFDTAWAAEQSEAQVDWKGEEDKQKGLAWAVLLTYFANTTVPPTEKPQGVEVGLEAKLEGLPTLVGIIDLVRPGGIVVDFKTTSVTPDPERALHQNMLQLTCYGLLYRHSTGEEEQGFELHHLVKTKIPKLVVTKASAITAEQEQQLYRVIESYVEGVEREDFVPSAGMQCLSCEYFNECRLQRR